MGSKWAGHDKSRRDKTRHDTTRRDETRQDTTRHNATRPDVTRLAAGPDAGSKSTLDRPGGYLDLLRDLELWIQIQRRVPGKS